jgi:anti-sigma B factor antagonist
VVEGDAFQVVVESRAEGPTIVRVSGDLDLATVPELERALAAYPVEDGLVLDLSECAFVDSSCVRLLVDIARETAEAGGKAAVVATEPGVLRILEITALDTLMSVHASVDEALDLLR